MRSAHVVIAVGAVGTIWFGVSLLSDDELQEDSGVSVAVEPSQQPGVRAQRGPRLVELDDETKADPSGLKAPSSAATAAGPLERQRARLGHALDRIVARREQLERDGTNDDAVDALVRHESRIRRELSELNAASEASESEGESGG